MVHNFAAGPAALPRGVLEQAQQALIDVNGTGLSILELPFGSPAYRDIAARAEACLRELLAIPSDYAVLFLQGGAYAHAALVAMNLMGSAAQACYAVTGHWARRAAQEASRYGEVRPAFAPDGQRPGERIPAWCDWSVPQESAYCHITSNETADGLQFHWTPECGAVPLVADVTSDFLTRPIDWRRYALVYASTQKNAGPSGLTVVIVREALLGRALPQTPAVFNYAQQAECGSRVNTPPVFAVYLAGLVFDWVRRSGGVEAMAARCRARSAALYAYCDQSRFYHCPVHPDSRSTVNLRVHLPDAALEVKFLQEAERAGLLHLQGHGAVGGIRISLYNAVSDTAVAVLTEFMERFAQCYRGAHRALG